MPRRHLIVVRRNDRRGIIWHDIFVIRNLWNPMQLCKADNTFLPPPHKHLQNHQTRQNRANSTTPFKPHTDLQTSHTLTSCQYSTVTPPPMDHLHRPSIPERISYRKYKLVFKSINIQAYMCEHVKTPVSSMSRHQCQACQHVMPT